MNNQLLTNRKWEVLGNWYAPKSMLEEYKSVEKVTILDMTSSAGDWSGLIFQRIGKWVHVITFSQENRGFGKGGFNVYTGEESDYLIEWSDDPNEMIEKYRVCIDDYCKTCM